MSDNQQAPRPAADITKRIWSPEKEDKQLIKDAYTFAQEAHKEQTRYSGRPYFHHAVETAVNLAEIGQDAPTVAAGLLHDTLDDTDVTSDDLQHHFNEEILFLVQGVSQLGGVRYSGLDRHVESLRKLFVATAQDLRVLIIKLADRLHNMQTLDHVPKEKQPRIAKETLRVYVPTAHRLGIGSLKTELEDHAFPFVHPDKHDHVRQLAEPKYAEAMDTIESMRKELATLLKKDDRIADATIDYRLKGLYSLYQKLERKDMNIDDIYDIAALRVIVDTIDECYQTLGIVNGQWQPLSGRMKDYIANPKPNGYQSLHTTVRTDTGSIAEVQIRTEDMHETAEYGAASHTSYKSDDGTGYLDWFDDITNALRPDQKTDSWDNSADSQEIPDWITDVVEHQEAAEGPAELMRRLDMDFFTDRVFVFTPDGDVIDLPNGATPIDFAYQIHTDIGNHTAEVKVNDKLVSLDTELKSGDIVEIITDNNRSPSRKWLEYAKTATARQKIRSAIQ